MHSVKNLIEEGFESLRVTVSAKQQFWFYAQSSVEIQNYVYCHKMGTPGKRFLNTDTEQQREREREREN